MRAMSKITDVKLAGAYRQSPWGYVGMTVRIYRAKKDGSLYAMRSARGVIATAKTRKALDDMALGERWIPLYRAFTREGREVWVSIPK